MQEQRMSTEHEFLRKIQIRLILDPERERYDALLETEHYLHSSRLGTFLRTVPASRRRT